MEKNDIVLVDFSFSHYLSGIKCVQSFISPSKYKRIKRLFTHKDYLADNHRLEDMVAQADIVILFDTRRNYDVVASRIEKACQPTAKLIFYSWNPITDSDAYTRLGNRWIKTTFSKGDAANTGFLYVGSFYFMNNSACHVLPKQDGVFVGCDKGRKELLGNVKQLFAANGLTSKIILVDNRKALFNPHYSWRIGYDKVCRLVQESNAVIEILQDGQEGISLRVFESLFFEKKLVTNNKCIVNYDFYDARNVFILGMDDETRFRDFILSPYVKMDEEIINQYKVDNWLRKMMQL